MNPNQLSLFAEIEIEAFRETANGLLEALNLERKPKDLYQIEYYYQHKDLYILIACNREKNIICNVVDSKGNIPKGFTVCWRIHSHVVEELERRAKKKINFTLWT